MDKGLQDKKQEKFYRCRNDLESKYGTQQKDLKNITNV